MAGYVGNIPVPQGTQTRQSFTATASQTSFPTIGYTAGFIDVYLNGIKLVSGADFTASNGSDVVLTTGAAVNDVLDVVIFDTFNTSSGTFSATTLKNDVTLKNDTEQDTDGGRASKIIYQGEQSGGEITTLAEIQASHDGTADDEKGDLIFRTNDGNDGASPTTAMIIDSAQNVGINAVPKVTHADADVLRFGGTGYIANWEDAEVYLAENMYQDTSGNYKYLTASHASLYSQTTGMHQFKTAASGSADAAITFAEKVRIDEDGLKFNGDTAAANALDDYEEGSWTPAITGVTITSGSFTGTYRKVGGIVTVTAYMSNANLSGSGDTITGFPFTNSTRTSSSMPSMYNHQHGDKHFNILLEGGGATAYMQYNTASGWVSAPISAGNARYMNFQITYCTSQ